MTSHACRSHAEPLPLLSDVDKATAIDIHDAFVSFIPSDVTAHLERTGTQFTYVADKKAWGSAPVQHVSGTLSAATVDAFLRAVAAHGRDPDQTAVRCTWTDDYPTISVDVTTPAHGRVHLGVADCARQWRADGTILSADPGTPSGTTPASPVHPSINAPYRALRDAIVFPK